MSLNCIICNSENMVKIQDRLRDSNIHKVFTCNNCGQVQINPIPTIDEDKKYYSNDSQAKAVFNEVNMDIMKAKSSIDVKRRYRMFKDKINKDMKLLEIGCGYGFFVEYLKNEGYDIDGFEISNVRREYGTKTLGCKIYDINLLSEDSLNFHKEEYDVIFMFHVLEHISEPEKFLRNVKKILKKEGTLIIEVPNLDDHMLERSEKYRDFYFQRAHITYFDNKTLARLLSKSGYSDIEFEGVQRYNLYNALNWLNKGQPILEYSVPREIDWIEKYYTAKLIKDMECDTLVAYCKINREE